MRIASPSTPTGHTLFCDDIRMEASGKAILVGLYSGHMFMFGEFPLVLPKLCFRISYSERPGESSDPIQIRIYFPGDSTETPTFSTEIKREQIVASGPMPDFPDSDTLISTILQFELAPATIKQAGPIRVRAYRGDTEVRLGSLIVHKAQSPFLTPPPAAPLEGNPL